jgi:hypothetical protein
VVNTTLRPLYSREVGPNQLYRETVWAPVPVWTVAENLGLTGNWSLDRAAISESLYRRHYFRHSNHIINQMLQMISCRCCQLITGVLIRPLKNQFLVILKMIKRWQMRSIQISFFRFFGDKSFMNNISELQFKKNCPCVWTWYVRVEKLSVCVKHLTQLWYLIKLYFELKRTESNVYWTVHHCNSWRIKEQLDVTCYFISLLMCSTFFGH